MHEYLDGDISSSHEKEMQQHLHMCTNCKHHMNELEHVVHLLQTVPAVQVPLGFTEKVMASLPKMKLRSKSWFRKHPLLVAVAIFTIFTSASLLSEAQNSEDFAVTNQEGLVVKGNQVVVPADATIKGDIVVENGDIIIEGKVDGNVTVVNGKYMASSANVTGQVEEIDETFEWLWYTIKGGVKKIFMID